MTERERAIADQRRLLERTFAEESGLGGARVQRLIKAEHTHAMEMTERLAWFTTLVESYQEFALQSLEEVSKEGTVSNVLSLALHVAAFRRFRVALNAFYDGHYLDALGTLRGVFEMTMHVGAVLKGYLSFNALYDMAPEQESLNMGPLEFGKRKHKHVTSIEQTIRDRMFGHRSGLCESDQTQIKVFLMCLHTSVHHGDANVALLVLGAVQRGQTPCAEPSLDLETASMFVNPASFLAWAHLRTLEYVCWPIRYSVDWRAKFTILDDSFRLAFEGWAKPFASAVLRLIDTSFRFEQAQASRQLTANGAA